MKQAFAAIPICLAFLNAGCAALGGPQHDGARAAEAAPAAPQTGVVLGALPEAALPAGACGMVLWTLDEKRPAPVFRYVSGKAGEIFVYGKTLSLERVSAGGASAYGVFETQEFVGDEGLQVSVAVQFSLGFDGGSYLERGLITLVSPDGWRTVTPAAGLAGCRNR